MDHPPDDPHSLVLEAGRSRRVRKPPVGKLTRPEHGPLPIRRLAVAHPETADAVFRKVLRKPGFTWAEHGESLLRRRKPWYYEHEPRPGVSVIGTRLAELAAFR
jgi:hypothetical protein